MYVRFRGETLNVKASGVVKQPIEEGATVWVEVKLGYIVLIRKTFDFCEQIKQVDRECPLNGTVTVEKDVELPKEIPPVSPTCVSTNFMSVIAEY
jgi:hypothetical protein